ncbi:MAG: sigma factor-like helix-turn-helix DNA-binding protein [Acidimicrobiales bacterium]
MIADRPDGAGLDTSSGQLGFEEFFAVHEPLLRRALAAGFGHDLGREAAAEALMYGWQWWDRVAELDNPAGYLYRVGERWAVRQRQRSTKRATGWATQPSATDRFEPGLAGALDSLTARQRQAVVLVTGFGLTHAEAADVLGIARTSLQNHHERGLTNLRRRLGADT